MARGRGDLWPDKRTITSRVQLDDPNRNKTHTFCHICLDCKLRTPRSPIPVPFPCSTMVKVTPSDYWNSDVALEKDIRCKCRALQFGALYPGLDNVLDAAGSPVCPHIVVAFYCFILVILWLRCFHLPLLPGFVFSCFFFSADCVQSWLRHELPSSSHHA